MLFMNVVEEEHHKFNIISQESRMIIKLSGKKKRRENYNLLYCVAHQTNNEMKRLFMFKLRLGRF